MTCILATVHHSGRILAAMLLALVLSATSSTAVGLTKLIPKTPAEQTAPEIKETEQPKKNILNLITYSTKLSENLIDMQSQLADITPMLNVQQDLPKIEEALESLNWQAMMQQADSNLSYRQLSDTLLLLDRQQDNLNDIAEPLNKAIVILADYEDYWNEERGTLTNWVETLNSKDSYALLQQNIEALQTSIESAIETIETSTKDTLKALNTISGLQVKMYNLKVIAGDLLEELRKEGWQQTSPSIFSHRFHSQLNSDILVMAWQNSLARLNMASRQIRDNSGFLLLILTLPILLSIVFIRNRKTLQKHSNWSLLTECPVAFSFFTVLIFFVPWLGPTANSMVPIFSITLVFSVMLLAGQLKKNKKWVTRFILFLSIYMILNLLVEFINPPLPLKRIYLLVGSGSWLAYIIWRLFAFRGHESQYRRWALLITTLALIVVIVVGVFGYDELAGYLFNGTFLTIFLFISSVILFSTTMILFELILSLLPVVRRHTDVIVHALQPLVFVLCTLVFYALTASIWHLYPSSREAVSALAALGFSLGDFTLTMKMVFTIVAIVYGAILISRAVQAILLDEVMPRNNIDIGVQLSISKLVHYSILLIGGIILLLALGADLTKLTILGGALGVGIGFGLQAIVNNFASGLILLFERPIKLGDTIELGTDLGEVKQLGLRSTIIQTLDNAEIVIPNSDLIAGQVTNWTLAERQARVKVPVGVAYGSDISKVLEILLTVAGEHPMVMTTPSPNALFLAFGASSLDFELRVWVADFSDRRQVLSELNQEINSEFADAGIEIPFPQADLHLRTVNDDAAEVLRSQGTMAET